jgi:hypothetical protein
VGDGVWKDYVAYWLRRFEELAGTRPLPPGQPKPQPPLVWERYRVVKGDFQRGVDFERGVSQAMQQEAALPPAERKLVPKDMHKPRVDSNVGVDREGADTLRYSDQVVVDEASLKPGLQPRVDAFSNKSRDFTRMARKEALAQVVADIREVLTKYGGVLEIRRPGHPLFGRKVRVSRVYLVYDARVARIDRRLLDQVKDIAASNKVTLIFHAN